MGFNWRPSAQLRYFNSSSSISGCVRTRYVVKTLKKTFCLAMHKQTHTHTQLEASRPGFETIWRPSVTQLALLVAIVTVATVTLCVNWLRGEKNEKRYNPNSSSPSARANDSKKKKNTHVGVALDAQMLIDHLVRPPVSYKILVKNVTCACVCVQKRLEEITLECPSAPLPSPPTTRGVYLKASHRAHIVAILWSVDVQSSTTTRRINISLFNF